MAAYQFPEKQTNTVLLALKEFSFCPELDFDTRYQIKHRLPLRADFPVPELVLFTLRDIKGLEEGGPEEKERWSIFAIFRETVLVFVMAKFGFEVEFAGSISEVKVAIGKLKKAVRAAEEGLRDFGQMQLQKGNVTIANRIGYFEHRYRYFRKLADEAYVLAEKDRKVARSKQGTRIGGIAPPDMDVTRAGMRRDQEGSFCSAAMMDAYFSLLEHKLTLMAAFIDFDPSEGQLEDFLGETWATKFKKTFDLAHNRDANALFQKLGEVKERWRNPLAHGGYEKEWSSVYFHLHGVGPIPATSSGFRNSAEFSLHPVEPIDHKTVCETFDAVDQFILTSHTKHAISYINAGLDVAFDQESRTSIAKQIVANGVDVLIDREDELRGQHGDMEIGPNHPDRMRFVSEPLTKFWR